MVNNLILLVSLALGQPLSCDGTPKNKPIDELIQYIQKGFPERQIGGIGGSTDSLGGRYTKLLVNLSTDIQRALPRRMVVEHLTSLMGKTRGFENLNIGVETLEEACKWRLGVVKQHEDNIYRLKSKHPWMESTTHSMCGTPEKKESPEEIFKRQGYYIPSLCLQNTDYNAEYMKLFELLKNEFWRVKPKEIHIFAHECQGIWQEKDKKVVILGLGTDEYSLDSLKLNHKVENFCKNTKGFVGWGCRVESLKEAIGQNEKWIEMYLSEVNVLRRVDSSPPSSFEK